MAKKGKENDFFGTEKRLFEIIDVLETDITKFIEPTNSVKQKKRFFEGIKKKERVNPRFSYLSKNPIFAHFTITPGYQKMKKELESIEIENTGVGKLLNKKKKESLLKMEFVRSIGSDEFPEKSEKFYGVPAKKTIKRAREILDSLNGKREEKNTPSKKAAEMLSKELKKRKVDWNIMVDENISPNAVVLSGHRLLKIRGLAVFSKADIRRLTTHEIETHIYRYLNGVKQPFRLFIEGAGIDWLRTEEGLAVINESIFELTEEEQIKNYAGRVIAVDYARKHSFYETFKYLTKFFDKNTSYQLAQRAKRGMNDTSKPGAFTKDYFYLKGALEVKEFVENGGNIKKLYYGKISLRDAQELESIPKLSKPNHLPNYPKKLSKKINFY